MRNKYIVIENINERLIWTIKRDKLNNLVLDQVDQHENNVDLENNFHEALKNKPICLGIFFVVNKAFDTAGRYTIIQTLIYWGYQEHIIAFIDKFLLNRNFQVRVNGTLSRNMKQQNGMPQGSINSPKLFLIAINDTIKNFPNPTQIFEDSTKGQRFTVNGYYHLASIR